MKEKKLKKAQNYSILGFSIITLGVFIQLFTKNINFSYSLLIWGSTICFFALLKAIKSFK